MTQDQGSNAEVNAAAPARVPFVWYGIAFALAAVLLWLFLKDADWSLVFEAILRIDIVWALAALAVQVLAILFAAMRWRLLLRPIVADVSRGTAWRTYCVGQTLVTLLPGRAGEIARPLLLARETGTPFSPIFGAVLVERVVDMIATLVLLATPIVFPAILMSAAGHPFIDSLRWAALIAGLLVAGVIAVIAVGLFAPGLITGLVRLLTRPIHRGLSDRLVEAAEKFFTYFAGLVKERVTAGVLATTAGYWIVLGAGAWMLAQAFALPLDLPSTALFLAVFALGSLVPTPSGAGSVHGVTILLLSGLWGFPADTVIAFAILNHLAFNLPLITFGLIHLVGGGLAGRAGSVRRDAGI
jgi:uncharacterized protein (TIRG00374 family)